MAEAGDWKSERFFEAAGEFEQIFETSARHDDIFVQLGEAGVAEGIGEFATELPKLLTTFRPKRALHKERAPVLQHCLQIFEFRTDGPGVSIQFRDQMCAAS